MGLHMLPRIEYRLSAHRVGELWPDLRALRTLQ